MPTVQVEQVLVVPTSAFRECGYFQGFCADTEKYLSTLLDSQLTRYLPRDQMEEDPSFKQLIPYCVFRYTEPDDSVHLFQYTRGSGQGEARLHAKKSVGIGGHISTLDESADSAYEQGMQRELDEELIIETAFESACVGLINDDDNPVGKVHLGVVHLLDVVGPEVRARENDLVNSGFQSISEIMNEIDNFETWSQICLRALFG